MRAELLQSQFDALEVPDYGIHIDITETPEEIIKKNKVGFIMRNKSVFGVFGLGVMGSSLSLNIADKGFALSVFNRADGGEEEVVKNFMKANGHRKNIQGFTDLEAFIDSLERPERY